MVSPQGPSTRVKDDYRSLAIYCDAVVISDVFPSADAGPTTSWGIVILTSVATLAMIVLTYGRARKRRQLAAEAASLLDAKATLREGEVVLTGVVEHADDHEVAVKVDVVQHGTESESSGSWSYSWLEVDRTIVVKPFYLVLADHTRIRVLAPSNVEVADALDQKVLITRSHRVLSAELIPGEALHVQGRLERGSILKPGGERGYRDEAYEWQLVPSHGRMLLSSEPLGRGLEERARFHRRYLIRSSCVFVVLQLLFANFYSRAVAPDRVVTVIDKQHVVSQDDDGDDVHDYHLTASIGTTSDQFDIDSDDFLRIEPGTDIVIRKGIFFGWDVGNKPTLFFMTVVMSLLLASLLPLLYLLRRTSTRPWFRRKVNNSGTGQLPGD